MIVKHDPKEIIMKDGINTPNEILTRALGQSANLAFESLVDANLYSVGYVSDTIETISEKGRSARFILDESGGKRYYRVTVDARDGCENWQMQRITVGQLQLYLITHALLNVHVVQHKGTRIVDLQVNDLTICTVCSVGWQHVIAYPNNNCLVELFYNDYDHLVVPCTRFGEIQIKGSQAIVLVDMKQSNRITIIDDAFVVQSVAPYPKMSA